MKPIVREVIKLKGIVRDIEPMELMPGSQPPPGVHSVNTWTNGNNVHFDDESTHRISGYADFADIPGGAVFQLNVLTPTTSYWIYVVEDGPYAQIWVTDGQSHWDISMAPILNSDPMCNDPAQWSGSNYVIEDGVCKLNQVDVATGVARNEGYTYVTGTQYDVSYEIKSLTGGEFSAVVRGGLGTGRAAPGVYTDTITAGSGVSYAGFACALGAGPYDAVCDNISVTDVGSTKITKAAGKWTGTVLNGVPVLNNGIDPPMWWDGNTANPVQVIPDWPANTWCKSIRAYRYHLVAMNISEDGVHIPHRVMWSNSALPGTIPSEWTPGPANDAGDAPLGDTIGGLVDGLPLRDSMILYKNHSTYLMQYIAGQAVFSFRLLFATSGIQNINCVQEMMGRHYVYTDDDVIVHDGNQLESIADNIYRGQIQKVINQDQAHFAHLAVDLPNSEIWVCVPTKDEPGCSAAVLYSYESGVWGVRELPQAHFVARGIIPDQGAPISWDDQVDTWNTVTNKWNESTYSLTNDKLVFSNTTGLYEVDAASDANGDPIEAFIERTYWTYQGDPGMWTNDILRSIYPHITGTAGDILYAQVAGTDALSQGITWSDKQELVIGSAVGIDALVTGRFLHIRISSSGGQPWQLHRMALEYVPKGKW